MKNRTAKALAGTRYILSPDKFPALIGAVDYAAQNSGLDYRNYSSGPGDQAGRKAYCDESKQIRKDWLRVVEAVQDADKAGVTDQDVIKAAQQAFSGRLEWAAAGTLKNTITGNVGYWAYRIGQYWPTEYRKAVATVLEHATHAVLQARPVGPLPAREYSLEEMKAICKARGGYFFSNKRAGERMTKLAGNRIKVTNPPQTFCGQIMPERVAIFVFNPETGSFNVEK